MIDMERISRIRSLHRKGESVAAIARAMGVSEPTVRKYLRMEDFSPTMKVRKKRSSKLDAYEPIVRQWLEEDKNAYRKQRHTITRIHQRLREECGAEISYSSVCNLVHAIKDEVDPDPRSQYLHLVWYPGEAQIDFGEADCCIKGSLVRMHYLVVVYPFSNIGFTQIFYGETAECVCQGLKDIFEYVGGVPKRCVFDNATGVGCRICDVTRLTDLFGRFCIHYGFDADFCNPYSGNEKGCVENKVATFRSNLLVSVPKFDSIVDYNGELLERSYRARDRQHYKKKENCQALFEEDCVSSSELPRTPFDVVRFETRRADKYGRLHINGCAYSINPSAARKMVTFGARAHTIDFFDAQTAKKITTMPRAYGDRVTEVTNPGAQLELLVKKPGGWKNSEVRTALSDPVRDWIDGIDSKRRKRLLMWMNDLSQEIGFDVVAAAMDGLMASAKTIEHAEVEILARRMRESGTLEPIEMSFDDDLSEFDDFVFSQGVS